MNKPTYINQQTYEFIIESIEQVPTDKVVREFRRLKYKVNDSTTKPQLLNKILQHPMPFLYSMGFVDRPDLLQNTVISMLDGVEFLIDYYTAIKIWQRDDYIVLKTLYNPKGFTFDIKTVLTSIKNSPTFDQL